jgi:hypothetical protein
MLPRLTIQGTVEEAAKDEIGVCAFCGELKALTREDAWPSWLMRYVFPPNKRVDRMRGSSAEELAASLKSGYTPRLKTRSVCEECNRGWLGPFEDRAKQRIKGWLTALRGPVTDSDKRLLAFWGCKTAMTVDLAAYSPAERHIPAGELRELHRNQTFPPIGVFVWCAMRAIRYRGIGHQSRSLPFTYRDRSAIITGPQRRAGYHVIFSIWHLEVHVLGLGVEGLNPYAVLPGYIEALEGRDAFYRLWPPESSVPILSQH